MYDKVIKNLIDKLEVVHENVVIKYLMVVYGATENLARQSVHSVYRSKYAYPKNNGYMVKTPSTEIKSTHLKMIKAFVVAMSLMKNKQSEFDFSCAAYPWQIKFTMNNGADAGDNIFIQICTIDKGMEYIDSLMISEKPVMKEDRTFIKRIVIVPDGTNTQLIKCAGFSIICTVDDDYRVNVLERRRGIDAWADVPEGV